MDKMKKMLKKRGLRRIGGKRGFTLVELLIVMTIIAILVAIVAMSLTGFLTGATETACEADWRSLQTAVVAFYAVAEAWPTAGGATGVAIDYTAQYDSNDSGAIDPADRRFRPDFVIDVPATQLDCGWQVDDATVGLVVQAAATVGAGTCGCEGEVPAGD